MRSLTIKSGWGKHTKIDIYESIKELPINRYHDFQKLILQDVGLGSDIDSIGRHFSQFHTYLTSGKVDDALQEAKNLHNNIFYMIEKVNIKSFSFACLIKTINGNEFYDLSQESIQEKLEELSKLGLTMEHVSDILENVKKKIKQSFEPIFLISSTTLE